MVKKYFVRNVNDPEMVTCTACNGTGTIKGTLTSDALEKPIEDTTLSCPICNGQGKIATGKIIHYAVGTVYIYGSASVEDEDKKRDYVLGFVCDDESMIENYKKQNGISSFVDFPGALRFYGTSETLYDTYDEAKAMADKMDSEWKPELKLEDGAS